MLKLINRLSGSKTVLFLAIVYSCTITTLFLIPTSGMPKVKIENIDKIVHILIFFFLLMIWQLYVFRIRGNELLRRDVLGLFIAGLIFGTLIEVVQEMFTAARSFDLLDIAADMIGVALAVLVFQKLKPIFRG